MLMMSLLAVSAVNAQWRLGVEGGVSLNWHFQDYGYATALSNNQLAGGSAMISTQYNFTDWFGLRADFGWAQRNYSLCHTFQMEGTDGVDYSCVNKCDYTRHYLMFPITASISFGGRVARAYVDLGAFVGGWLGGAQTTKKYTNGNLDSGSIITEPYEFNPDRDIRVDAGLVGRIGVLFNLTDYLYLNVEAVDYWGMVNSHKTGSKYFTQNAYDNTVCIQIGIGYTFN